MALKNHEYGSITYLKIYSHIIDLYYIHSSRKGSLSLCLDVFPASSIFVNGRSLIRKTSHVASPEDTNDFIQTPIGFILHKALHAGVNDVQLFCLSLGASFIRVSIHQLLYLCIVVFTCHLTTPLAQRLVNLISEPDVLDSILASG